MAVISVRILTRLKVIGEMLKLRKKANGHIDRCFSRGFRA
jgi:hypothetical protein